MLRSLSSLRRGGMILGVGAFLAGMAAASVWLVSSAKWQAHLDRAALAGAALYEALQRDGAGPVGTQITVLAPLDQALAGRGQFDRISGMPRPALVTHASILPGAAAPGTTVALTLAVVSEDLRYPLAGLTTHPDQTPAETLSALTRVMASYCSDPVLFAKAGIGPWRRVEGADLWGCDAAPRDLRMGAVVLAVIALAVLWSFVANTAAQFAGFARELGNRHRIGGPETYDSDGPQELREIVAAVNDHLVQERDRLAKRAAVLSGVSHDLGTPATRLRLRAALVADAGLRAKFEADIDQMTGIIESVLTYTRAEMDAEAPREIALESLIDSIVADYQDTGRPVSLRSPDRVVVQGGPSLFMSARGQGAVPGDRQVIVMARPIALTRAITNLVDNALKYGRRATVGLETDADGATITIEDEGTDTTVEDIERLMAPFKRGENTGAIHGYGLGLTIAATVAAQHGGALGFQPGARGLIARIRIRRH